MEYQKVKDRPGLVRDKETGAVLYTNSEQQVQAMRARKASQKKKEQDIENLKNDVSELKNMMKQIIEKL
tara:strand:- start:798 stop:1004 length:207 start_codon:yes stop_codon:yes gene_type:complete